jgi:hypothetical protein
VGVRTPCLTETKMIARQHCAWILRILGARVGTPGRVAMFGLQPANQISDRAAYGMRAGNGIERNQVQPADAGLPRRGLGLHLNQFVVTRQTKGSGRDWMLGGRGNGRSTPLRGGCGRISRVTAQEATAQRNQLEEARRRFHGQP